MALVKRHTEKHASRCFSFSLPNKAVSLLASFVLAFSLFPVQAFADNNDSTDTFESAAAGHQVLSIEEEDTPAAGSHQVLSIEEDTPAAATEQDAADSTDDNTGSTDVAAETVITTNGAETIVLATDTLDLIQNGRYRPLELADNPSRYATSLTSAQKATIKSTLNTALANVTKTSTSTDGYGNKHDIYQLDLTSIGCAVTCDTKAEAGNVTKTIIEETVNDNPDLFYISSSYSYGYSQTSSGKFKLTKVIALYEFDVTQIKSTMKPKYDAAMKSILSWVPVTKNAVNGTVKQIDQVKALHDWLVRNCKYNTEVYSWLQQGKDGYSTYYSKHGNGSPWTSYGALVDKQPVCQGYSLAFIAACKRLGITATFVENQSANHGWNRVYLSDDKSWYNLDITWDDPLTDKGFSNTPITTYFMKCDTHFKKIDSTHSKWTPAGTAASSCIYESWNRGTYSAAAARGTVNKLTITNAPLTINPNSTQQLNLNIAANGNVLAAEAVWTSSNPSVVSVSSTGKVTSSSTNGTATITVTLGGKSTTCVVTVKQTTAISGATVTLSTSSFNYVAGLAQYPTVTVKSGSTTLTKGKDYTINPDPQGTVSGDFINPGTKTITITGMGDYSGTKTATYRIVGKMSSVSTKAKSTAVNYNGSAQKIGATVTFAGSGGKTLTLVEGTDYTLTYPSDTTSAGTKTVTVTGKGNWTGTASYTYKINPLNISTATVDYQDTVRYTGSAVTQNVAVKVGSNTIPSTQYTTVYKNNVNAGSATITFTGKNNCTGAKVVSFKITKTASWTRLKGTTALQTMKAITNDSFSKSNVVVIATSGGFADALAASALAGKHNAPILMTAKASLSAETKAEIQRLGAKTAYICGGRGVVSDAVEAQIKAAGCTSVTRLKGVTATDTSREIAKSVGSARSDTVIIASSTGYQDALSISPYAYTSKSPIILAEKNGTLSSANTSYIKSAGFSKAIIVGGKGVVKATVETQLSNVGVKNITRLKGPTAYDTSKAIADWEVTKGGMTANGLGVATGKGYADALAGSALCGQNHSVLLLADSSNSANAKNFIASKKLSITSAYIFGGRGVVSAQVMNTLQTASN